jgi:hypothetical protein
MVDLFKKVAETDKSTDPPVNQRVEISGDRTQRSLSFADSRRPVSTFAARGTPEARRRVPAPVNDDFIYYQGPGGTSFVDPHPNLQGRQSGSRESGSRGSRQESVSSSSDGDSINIVSNPHQRDTFVDEDTENMGLGNDTENMGLGNDQLDSTQTQPHCDSARFRSSALCQAAALDAQTEGRSSSLLLWQAEGVENTARAKMFRKEVLNGDGLLVFAYMRPGSVFVHLLHSITIFSADGGEDEIQGQVFGFLGDRTTGIIRPIPTGVPDKLWKWLPRKVILDTAPLETFYSVPANAKKLYHPISRTGEQTVAFPRVILLPPELIMFCAEDLRTPFAVHQKTVELANNVNSEITLENSHLLRDWCIAASHDDATPAVHASSIMDSQKFDVAQDT